MKVKYETNMRFNSFILLKEVEPHITEHGNTKNGYVNVIVVLNLKQQLNKLKKVENLVVVYQYQTDLNLSQMNNSSKLLK